MIKKVASSTAVVLSIVVCSLALWVMRDALQLLVIALAISSGMNPLIEHLIGRGARRLSAIALTFVGVLVPLLALILILGAQLVTDMTLLAERFPSWYMQLRQMIQGEGAWGQSLGRLLPDNAAIMAALAGPGMERVGLAAVSGVARVAFVVVMLVSIASLGFYWLADQQRIERLLLSLLPSRQRSLVRSLWSEVYEQVGVAVRGEIALVACGMGGLFLIYQLLGVTGASALAILGGLALLVPVVSIPLALLPGVLAASMQSPLQGLLALLGSGALLIAIRRLLAPWLFRSGISTNPVLVIVLTMLLADSAGFWAFLFAPPLAAAIQAIVRAIRAEQQRASPHAEAIEVSTLQDRIEALAQQLADDQPEAVRIKDLLNRARRVAADVAGVIDRAQETSERPPVAQASHYGAEEHVTLI